LLRPAADRLAAYLTDVAVRVPSVPVYAMGLKRHDSPEAIRAQVVAQLAGAVRWTDTIRDMIGHGVTQLVECGPGKVLTALNRRIERNKDIAMSSIEDPASLSAALNLGA
jgi:[acyl-carrier-protein] S-malonyltransferase